MTCEYGWRNTYIFSGVTGIVLGVFGLLYLQNPMEGKYDKQSVQEIEQAAKDSQYYID